VQREPILIFDGDCAFCSSSIRLVKKVISSHPQIKPFQWTDLSTLGLTEKECRESVQFYKDQNNRFSGAQSFAQFLILSSKPWNLFGYFLELPLIKWIAKIFYGLIAKNRYRLPGGTPACKLPENE
jgi:predicted DCC family thiol-disulfide oxidoreductase YuxK